MGNSSGSTTSLRPLRPLRPLRAVRSIAIAAALVVVAAGCEFHPSNTTHPQARAARQQINALIDEADVADAEGDTDTAADRRQEAADLTCEVFGCKPVAGSTEVRFDPSTADGFFGAPWPSDTRREADGSLDLTGFPGRATLPLADLVLSMGATATRGFGTNSAIYFQTDAPVDESSVPVVAEASLGERSNVMLLDLDDPQAPRIPLLAHVTHEGSDLRPENLLAVLPYPGHPLRPDTRYAAVVFDGVRDTTGLPLAPSPTIGALDGAPPADADPAVWSELRSHRDATFEAVRAQTMWHPSEVVAFTVFTTQEVAREMDAVAAAVAELPTPQFLARTPDLETCAPGETSRSRARIALPVWQEGDRPYVLNGGNIVIDDTGRAVQQGDEMGVDGQGVVVDVAIPCGPAPSDGWPILLFMDGTGGSANASIPELGPDLPYAVFSIAPMFSSDRAVAAPPPFDDPGFQFFNYANPLGARNNQIQQAADMLYLQRAATTLSLEADEGGGGVDGRLDADTVVMAGHSQGATTLPLTLAVTDDVRGAFLSASGGGLAHSVVHRGDVRVLLEDLLGIGPDELDLFHPYPQVLQTFAETGDPTNFAGRVTADVALYAGLRDGCTAIEVSTQLATALEVPVVTPLARSPLFGLDLSEPFPAYRSVFEPPVVAAPVSANLPGGRTGAVVQVDTGHFGASRYPAIGRSFVDSIAAGGPVVIDPGDTPALAPGSACPRHTPVPAGS